MLTVAALVWACKIFKALLEAREKEKLYNVQKMKIVVLIIFRRL